MSMTYHVLVPDSVHPSAVRILESAPEINVTAPGQMKRDETLAAVAEADALIIRSATKADAALINAATKLKAIARAGVGVDNVDLEAASAKGIAVMNTPEGNTIATAEFTFGLMLALARHIPQAYASMLASGIVNRIWAWNCAIRRLASSAWGASGRRWRGGRGRLT
jgi:D-3-phosphoglycerate dehydrogenase